MNKEETLLLYKDLSGRTTYRTKIQHDNGIFTFDDSHCGIGMIDIETSPKIILSGCYYGDNIKPYLFPLSSMTEEQLDEYTKLCTEDTAGGIYYFSPDSIDWLNKHHFDWRGLIEKGLALDATGLGIYWVTSNLFTIVQNKLVKRSKEVNGKA
jgi:hypothetical protein